MSLLILILFGALVGWLTSILMGTNSRQGLIGDILLGIVGAFIGSFVFNLFGYSGVGSFDLYSILVAVVGSALLIYVGRLLSGLR